jgi:Sulfotransferase family
MSKLTPTFIGIGTGYAGLGKITTWLGEHPAIADHVPALNFFSTSAYTKHGYDWYAGKLAEQSTGVTCFGDCSPSYLYESSAAERIARDCPRTKLFVVLRHPLLRALAEYEALRSIDGQAQRMKAVEYLARFPKLQTQGFYADYLESYLVYYSTLELKVIFYEDLVENPLTVMQDLYAYLEVDKNFVPKELKSFVPPPEEPKHPGLIKRTRKRIYKLYKKLTTAEAKPLFTPDSILEANLSSTEKSLFIQAYLPSVDRLSRIVGKDMATYWHMRD